MLISSFLGDNYFKMNYINKIKSDGEYVSPSEKYIITIVSTYISVYDVENNAVNRLAISNISRVCITLDDRFLYFSKLNSSYLYVYDLIKLEICLKKIIKRNTEIYSINQMNNTQLIILLKDKKSENKIGELYKFNNYIYIYNSITQNIENIELPNVNIQNIDYPIKINHEFIFPINIYEKKDNKVIYKKEYYEIHEKKLKHRKVSQEYYDNNEIIFSNSQKYYAKIFNYYVDDSINIDEQHSKIIIYDKQEKEVFRIKDRKFDTPIDILTNCYRGKFVSDLYGVEIFYTPYNKNIELYYMNGKIKKLFVDMPIINVYLSFKKDFILINSPSIISSYCYIYKLSSFFDD